MTNDASRPLFSIIMPVYGVEAYISEAIQCIRSQTFQDWELLVIDDHSPDSSATIAREHASMDDRIRIISHAANRGLSAARNTGIAHAQGRYAWFPDPDDSYDETLLKDGAKAIGSQPCDLVVFGHLEEYFDASGAFQYAHPIIVPEHRCDTKSSLREEVLGLEQATVLGYAWNKLYDVDRIKAESLAFEEDAPLIEDIVFNVAYFENASSAAFLGTTPYHYAKRLSSNLTNKFVPNYFELHRRRIQLVYDQQRRWGLNTPDRRAIIGALYGRYILSALERNCDPRAQMAHTDRIQWCRRLFADDLFNELIPCAKATESTALRVCLAALRTRNPQLCTALGRMIHVARNKGGVLFSKVKSER